MVTAGFSKEQVKVKVDDGFLVVSTADQSPAQEAGPVKVSLLGIICASYEHHDKIWVLHGCVADGLWCLTQAQLGVHLLSHQNCFVVLHRLC